MSEALGEHFRKWLRAGMTGCTYATSFAGRGSQVAIETHATAPPVEELDRNFDEYAKSELAAIVVLPFITDEAGLVELLNGFARNSARWVLRRRPAGPSDAVLVGVDWRTAAGDVSDTMGFAPFPHMPVPRRAPYVAIATWPGGRANPQRGVSPTPPARPGQVSFLDAAHGFDPAQYAKSWSATEAAVAELMKVPPDDARRYRRVSFVLSATAASALSVDDR